MGSITTTNGLEDLVQRAKEINGPVVIKFGASWCVPCQRVAPQFEALSTEFQC